MKKEKSVLGESCEEKKARGTPGRETRDMAAMGDVAETHTTNDARDQTEDDFLKYRNTHVSSSETTTWEKGESSLAGRTGPNKRMGPSNYTPTQDIQPLGLSSKNSKGGLESACKVFSRQRWFKKKKYMGQNSPKTMTETGTSSLQGQHLQDEIQQGNASNINCDSTTRSAIQVEDPEEIMETQCIQQATNIWSMAKHLGAT